MCAVIDGRRKLSTSILNRWRRRYALWAGQGASIAVLGDMLEMGSEAALASRSPCEPIEAAGAIIWLLCGCNMKALWDVYFRRAQRCLFRHIRAS